MQQPNYCIMCTPTANKISEVMMRWENHVYVKLNTYTANQCNFTKQQTGVKRHHAPLCVINQPIINFNYTPQRVNISNPCKGYSISISPALIYIKKHTGSLCIWLKTNANHLSFSRLRLHKLFTTSLIMNMCAGRWLVVAFFEDGISVNISHLMQIFTRDFSYNYTNCLKGNTVNR